jgi:hypothetical protein
MRRLLAVAAAAAMLTGCSAAGAVDQAPTSSTGQAIRAELAKARVVPTRPDVPGYKRAQFGSGWIDVDHNHCRTRDDVLGDQLTNVQRKGACTVIAGTLVDPYTGRTIQFRKADAAAVQIDHVYPLSLAWDMGAASWTEQRRVEFANDRKLNLTAVDGPTNASKGDHGPGEWLPVDKAGRCPYVLRFLRVARAYQLPITQADREAAETITGACS